MKVDRADIRGGDSMKVEQFVMAYGAEQDCLRAFLPEGFESLRPVLRINAEIRQGVVSPDGTNTGETVCIEFNTPAEATSIEAKGKRGWLNIASWETPKTEITYERNENSVTFKSEFLEITYTGVGIEGGCPAERDNDGVFFLGENAEFRAAEQIDSPREFCNCQFKWKFAEDNAHGISIGGKSVAAYPTEAKHNYEKQKCCPEVAAAIECRQILGAYKVQFERKGK